MWWNCARVPGRSRPRAGFPRRWRRRPLPRAPAARRVSGDTPTRDSRGPAATPGRGPSARCAAGPGAGAGTAGRAGVRPHRGASGARYPAHHQVQSLKHVPGEPVQQRRQQHPITRGEPRPVRTKLPLQDRELMAQREDLRVFVPAAHRQQPQQREHVRHTEIGQSQQHGRSPCHSVPLSHERPTGRHRAQHRPHPCIGSHQDG